MCTVLSRVLCKRFLTGGHVRAWFWLILSCPNLHLYSKHSYLSIPPQAHQKEIRAYLGVVLNVNSAYMTEYQVLWGIGTGLAETCKCVVRYHDFR